MTPEALYFPNRPTQTAATKVDRTQYDARAALISEKSERFRKVVT